MLTDELSKLFARALAECLAGSSFATSGLHMDRPGGRYSLSDGEVRMLCDLIADALRHGLAAGPPAHEVQFEGYGGGNTARAVLSAVIPVRLVVKVHREPSLLDEARLLAAVQDSPRLPESLKRALPRVYSVRSGESMYAYAMEDFAGCRPLASLLTHDADPARIGRLIGLTLDLLFEAFRHSPEPDSVPVRPDPEALYVQRILNRLPSTLAALGASAAGRRIDEPWVVNGRSLDAPASYLRWLSEDGRRSCRLSGPPFVTYVHGDPHARNVLVASSEEPAVKLIDPKGWGYGDYLYDVAKLAQSFEPLGALQRHEQPEGYRARKVGNRYVIDYSVTTPAWKAPALGLIKGRTATFAAHGLGRPDPGWEARYLLAMAAMLLGAIPTQVDRERPHQTVVRLARGLEWLDLFREAALECRDRLGG